MATQESSVMHNGSTKIFEPFPVLITQDLPVTNHHDIYPGIDPAKYAGSMTGKIVFITGASRGIGESIARAFAQSGASLFLAARKTETLEEVKTAIVKSFPTAKVGYHPTDVSLYEDVNAAVEACVTLFGKIDVVISNAGIVEPMKKLTESDPALWWRTWEVNVKGSFHVAHCTLPYLTKTKGYLIFIGAAQQFQIDGLSSYQSGKHALNRITEHIFSENEALGIKVFTLHPGSIKTDMTKAGGPAWDFILTETLQLPAWTSVRLASGAEDYLSGRYVSCTWDLDEVAARFRDSIMQEDALKNRLLIPREAPKT